MKREHDGGPPYMVHYSHDGNECAFTMGADDWDDAQARLRSIGYNGRVVGSNVHTYQTNALTLPLVAIWVPLLTWWKNLWVKRP